MAAKKYKPLYEQFSGEELEVAQKIQQRRLQMLVHSRAYYLLDSNMIEDYKWSEWGQELKNLQEKYPTISKKVPYYKEFADWTGDSGAGLPLDEPWVRGKTEWLLMINNRSNG